MVVPSLLLVSGAPGKHATTIPQLCVRGPGPALAELSQGPCLTLQGEFEMRDTDCCGRVAEKPASEADLRVLPPWP